jgi:hypothetical protein
VADKHVPVITLFLIFLAYLMVTFEKINLCVQIGIQACR